jgi:hypothetical protein
MTAKIKLNATSGGGSFSLQAPSSSTNTRVMTLPDQLDMLYKDIVDGKLDTTGTWATHIKAVKDANPKP